MADADDGAAPVPQRANEIGGVGGFPDAESCRGLIEQDDIGAGTHGARDGNDLALSARQHADRRANRLYGDLELVEERTRLALHAAAVDEPAATRQLADIHIGGNIQNLDQSEVLEHGGDTGLAGIGGRTKLAGFTIDHDGSGIGTVHAADGLDQRRLAGAIVADHRQDFARGHFEVDIGQGLDLTEGFGNTRERKAPGIAAGGLMVGDRFSDHCSASRFSEVTKVMPVSMFFGTLSPLDSLTMASTAPEAMPQKFCLLVP